MKKRDRDSKGTRRRMGGGGRGKGGNGGSNAFRRDIFVPGYSAVQWEVLRGGGGGESGKSG